MGDGKEMEDGQNEMNLYEQLVIKVKNENGIRWKKRSES